MPKKKAPKSAEATPSKRQQVLEHMAVNPQASPGEVAAALKEKGVDITPAYVSNIKSTAKTKRKRGRKAKRAAAAPAKKATIDLATAVQLVAKLGGLERAKKTIGLLEEIKRLV